MKKTYLIGISTAAVALTAVAYLSLGLPQGRKQEPKSTPLGLAPKEKPLVAKPDVQAFIQKNAQSPDPHIQDRVGRARLQLAYFAAKQKDFKSARQAFQTAAREYKGTGEMRSDFGGIPDQAAYQAAVCLVADGKKEEARKEFLRFLRERSLSPLVHAAYRRLQRLNGGETDKEGQDLLQAAISKQEARIRFETSTCGPKAIAYMLPLLGKPTRDYHEIAKLCGTDGHGTTLEGMRKGFEALGITVSGVQVNRRDFALLKGPFIFLDNDHYLVATKVDERFFLAFDPRDKTERKAPLPPLDDTKFLATVLVTDLPTLNSDLP